jgi:hypothetical protein
MSESRAGLILDTREIRVLREKKTYPVRCKKTYQIGEDAYESTASA